MGLIRWLAIILLIYLGFRLLARYVFPWLIRWVLKRTQEKVLKNFEQQQREAAGYTTVSEDEDVTIEYVNSEKQQQKKDGESGEYVDFEEL